MFTFRKLFSRTRQHSADAKFLRFLNLNFHAYADLCVFGSTSRVNERNDDVAAACREWLPNLSDPTHRHICEAIARFHEASEKRANSLDSLMTALDKLREESPSQYGGLLPATLNRVDALISDKRTGNPVVVDFKTDPRSNTQSPDSAECSYCSEPGGLPAYFLSGEPVFVCESSKCISDHDRLLRSEYEDFLRVGLVTNAQYH